jgi:hypothetical protein
MSATIAGLHPLLKALRAPFPEDQIHWRKGGKPYNGKFKALAYLDQRDVEDRLDEVTGGKWQCEHYTGPNNTVICKIGIEIDGVMLWKSDGGQDLTDSDDIQQRENADKGAYSNAFKRAASTWGVGRYLYRCKAGYVAFNQYHQPEEGEMKRLIAALRKAAGMSAQSTGSENVSTKPQNDATSHDPVTGEVDDTDPNNWREQAPPPPLPDERFPDMGEVLQDHIPDFGVPQAPVVIDKQRSVIAREQAKKALDRLKPSFTQDDMDAYMALTNTLKLEMLPEDWEDVQAHRVEWKALRAQLSEVEKLKAQNNVPRSKSRYAKKQTQGAAA